MAYNSYEEYMNSLLGKKNLALQEVTIPQNIIINTEIDKIENNEVNTYDLDNNKFESFYPDIYKIIYPMVCKRCLNVDEDITENLVEKITNEIYEAVENDEEHQERKEEGVYNNFNNLKNYRNYRNMPKVEEIKTIKETRQRNYLLNDLIRILVLRELIGSGRRPPHSMPPRPPMPPRPGEFPPPLPPRPDGRPPGF